MGWWSSDPLITILATFNGGLEEDDLDGGYADPVLPDGDELNGGQGDDDIDGNDGNDDIHGGEDDDELYGHDGDDHVRGDDGDDDVYGHEDDDIVRGGSGDDYVEGGDGADDVDGEDGSDGTNEWDDGGVDKVRGGDGTDRLYYNACNDACSNNDNVTITENGALDDGDVEEDPGNDFDGFENIDFDVNSDARATVVAGSDTGGDSIQGGGEIDAFTPGPGPDFLNMGDDNDTANTIDGYPDVVDCGQEQNDTDTANADQFDQRSTARPRTSRRRPARTEIRTATPVGPLHGTGEGCGPVEPVTDRTHGRRDRRLGRGSGGLHGRHHDPLHRYGRAVHV